MNKYKLFTLFNIYSIIYWSIYIIRSFINWELRNPFQWMLDLSNDYDLRCGVLGLLFMCILVGLMLYHIFLDNKGKFEDPNKY